MKRKNRKGAITKAVLWTLGMMVLLFTLIFFAVWLVSVFPLSGAVGAFILVISALFGALLGGGLIIGLAEILESDGCYGPWSGWE